MYQAMTRATARGSADGSALIYHPYYAPATPPGGHIIYAQSPLKAYVNVPAATPWTNSAIVNRVPLRYGFSALYAYGAVDQRDNLKPPFSGPASGRVQSSFFQPWFRQLVGWQFNNFLFRAGGYPQNFGFSFKVSKLPTASKPNSGGPTTGMLPRGIWSKVQTIPRFDTTPRSYNTISARS